jgi:ATP-dependent Clp protease ATP-binding subunit ClpC
MNPESTPSTLPVHFKTARALRRQLGPAGLERLDVDCESAASMHLDRVLHSRIIGQDESLQLLTSAFSRLLADLRDPGRPALSFLLLGPTGVGKTETARAFADALFGDETALTRINCEEYAHGHEVSKLLGPPPGYVGFGMEPLLSQRRIDRPHLQAVEAKRGMVGEDNARLAEIFPSERGKRLSIVLFDEIEKAHPIVWNALLGILEGGVLTLGDNSTTDFAGSIVILTSNAGSMQCRELMQRSTIGFSSSDADPEAQLDDLEAAVLLAARETFPPEFLNRLDDVLVYGALERKHVERIFDKFLADLHERALRQAGFPLLIRVSPDAKRLIVTRGADPALGARPLRRAIDALLVAPLSRLIAARSVTPGDVLHVERESGGDLAFYRDNSPRAAVVA